MVLADELDAYNEEFSPVSDSTSYEEVSTVNENVHNESSFDDEDESWMTTSCSMNQSSLSDEVMRIMVKRRLMVTKNLHSISNSQSIIVTIGSLFLA